MFKYDGTLEAMRRERASMQAEVEKLDQAIAALQELVGTTGTKHRLSAQARRRISQAQKKRWAKMNQGVDANSKRSKASRPKISAQGLRNIIEAQKKRWAKVRAAGKRKVATK